jgi:hypothetical protein
VRAVAYPLLIAAINLGITLLPGEDRKSSADDQNDAIDPEQTSVNQKSAPSARQSGARAECGVSTTLGLISSWNWMGCAEHGNSGKHEHAYGLLYRDAAVERHCVFSVTSRRLRA